MKTMRRARYGAAIVGTAALLLSACGSDSETTDTASATESEAAVTSVEVTDARGTVEVPVPAEAIVATDNRIFRTLDEWGVELVAAPKEIMPEDVSYTTDDNVIDLGNHGEPNMEGFVEANPDLVLNGMRFDQFYDQIAELVPEAALVDTSIDVENNQLDEELRRQITLLGTALQNEDGAEEIIAEFDKSIEEAKAAYNPDQTVMGLLTSGGEISYVAPNTGRTIGPIFPVIGLTPALEQEADDTSHGDDISVEAIAEANPDWIIVMDRDAAITEEGEYSTAEELLTSSEALQNVTAIQEGNIIYLPNNMYLTEDIQAYTEVFTNMAEVMGESS